MDSYFVLIVVALITALAVWQREGVFFRIIATPVLIVYGLQLADTDTTGSTLWMAGVVIAIIGTSFIFSAVVEELRKYVSRKKGG